MSGPAARNLGYAFAGPTAQNEPPKKEWDGNRDPILELNSPIGDG